MWDRRFDLTASLGAAIVALGAGMVYVPAGLIVAGLYVFTSAHIAARAAAHRRES